MAKRTAIIDIGSNSVRMVIFERTSRFAFHIIYKVTSRVRISEDAYQNNNNLQEQPMLRAYKALEEFSLIIKQYKVRKTLCVATSALRDAPNKKAFVSQIKRELFLNIKVIDGEREAYLGGIAAANLLHLKSALTIDIGGGSTELALYEKRKVIHTFSLNLGTVRLKELFFDKGDIEGAKEYIRNELSQLPSAFQHSQLVGIGGTLRYLSKMIAEKEDLYFKKLHGFSYAVAEQENYFNEIMNANEHELKELGVKKERLDVIQPGLLILQLLIEHIGAKNIITSSVGVREGLYLSDLLRTQQDTFPANYNPSVTSLLDRFTNENRDIDINRTDKLFDLCAHTLNIEPHYKPLFLTALKLGEIGKVIDLYESHQHSYYLLLNSLNYGFSQEETVLISTLVRYQHGKAPSETHLRNYTKYLPKPQTTKALSLLTSLARILYSDIDYAQNMKVSIDKDVLSIDTQYDYLLRESIEGLQTSELLTIKVV